MLQVMVGSKAIVFNLAYENNYAFYNLAYENNYAVHEISEFSRV